MPRSAVTQALGQVPAETAAILDGLYAAVTDAGQNQRRAAEALRAAHATSRPDAVADAQADLKRAIATLMHAGMVYRVTLHGLPAAQRRHYLADRSLLVG